MKIDDKIVDYLRVTGCNMITRAGSGHPGVVLSGAPIMYAIYKCASINSSDSHYFNRDRIIVSAGHASALYYATLNLFGYNITTEDLQDFRTSGSNTPGHPEVFVTDGVDCSTGPLGQGIANAVGFALAESYMAARYNHTDNNLIDHYTYAFCGDGCLMEGVAQEAISFAGHQKLHKLIVLYDCNKVTIEGKLNLANTENTKAKFVADGWNVLEVKNGNSVTEIEIAINLAKQSKNKPSLIIVNTTIGYGSPLAGNCKCHGSPFSESDIAQIKANLGYEEKDWKIPADIKKAIAKINSAKLKNYATYQRLLERYKNKYYNDYEELRDCVDGTEYDVLSVVKENEHKFSDCQSTRNINGIVLNCVSKVVPGLIGGNADLGPSTKAVLKEEETFTPNYRGGKNIYFGIREHAMGAICNGIALHGGLIPYCGTFFAFENYMTPAIRMSALMPIPVIYTFTHDSIAVGEDGPTHQPVEQIATLRAMPNVRVFRPCNYEENFVAYDCALNTRYPTALVLSRQEFERVNSSIKDCQKGGYVIKESKGSKATIIATGSEVALAVKVAELLKTKGVSANVVSMPCVELFEEQSKTYKDKVLGKNAKVYAIEASSDNVWYRYITERDNLFNVKTFGRSATPEALYKENGMRDLDIANAILKDFKKSPIKE